MARINFRTNPSKWTKAKVRSSNAPRVVHTRPVEMVTSLQIHRCPAGCHTIFISRDEVDVARGDYWTFLRNDNGFLRGSRKSGMGVYRLRGNVQYYLPRYWLDTWNCNLHPFITCWESLILVSRTRTLDMEVMVRFVAEFESEEDRAERQL